MASLTGTTVANTYESLLKITNNGPIDGTLRNVTDGAGTSAKFQLNNAGIKFTGNADFTSATVTGITTTDTTYDLSSAQSTNDVNINLVGSDTTTDTVKLVAGTNITLTDDGSNNVTIDATGGGTPGGSDTQFQYNNGGAFGGASGLLYNDSTNQVFIAGTSELVLSSGADLDITQGNLTMSDGNMLITGSIDHQGNHNINGTIVMETNQNISWVNFGGATTKTEGILWPDVQGWGEALDNHSSGDYLAVDTAITPSAGFLYVQRTGGGWVLADADAQVTSGGLLGFATHNVSTNRFLVRGLISVKSTEVEGVTPGIGDVVYVGTDAGHFTVDAPSGAGDIIRKCGAIIDTFVSGRTTYYKIWFDPDWYYETV